ncbi:MAG: hypothetical protein VB934_15545 [Polyangiaceae bacterium]
MRTKLLQSASVWLAVFLCIAACSDDKTSTAGSGSSTASSGAGGEGGAGGGAGDGAGDVPPECGNGKTEGDGEVEGSEICDGGGETAECDSDCTQVSCGDGMHNVAAGEACDDGNQEEGDACSSTCEVTPFAIAGPDIVELGQAIVGFAGDVALVVQETEAGGRFVVINAHTPRVDGIWIRPNTFVEYRGYAASGAEEIPLTQLSTSKGAWKLGAAANADGRVLVAWSSAEEGIRMHPIDADGLPVGKKDQPVGNKEVVQWDSTLAVAALSDGRFCMLWKQQSEGGTTNALRCVNELGTGFLAPVATFEKVAPSYDYQPALIAAGEGVVAVWPDFNTQPAQSWGQGWSTNGESTSLLFPVAQVRPNEIIGARRPGTGFLIGYSFFSVGVVGDVYAGFSSSPTSFEPAPTAPQGGRLASILTVSAGRMITLWQDRKDDPELRLDLLSSDGKPLAHVPNVSMVGGQGQMSKYRPRAAVTAAGDVMVAWWDYSPPDYKVMLMGVIHPRLLEQLTP